MTKRDGIDPTLQALLDAFPLTFAAQDGVDAPHDPQFRARVFLYRPHICRQLLGLDDRRIAELISQGVLETPQDDVPTTTTRQQVAAT